MSERMENERVDLSALDLGMHPDRLDMLVGRIMEAAEPELQRRAATGDPFWMLQSWTRPVLAAAAAISMLALGLMGWQSSLSAADGFGGVAEALDIGGPAYEWLMDERAPTDADMIAFLEDSWP